MTLTARSCPDRPALLAFIAGVLLLIPSAWAKVTPSPYRDLATWGADRQLKAVSRGEEIHLTNRWMKFQFRNDSSRLLFNDVEFRLSDKVVFQQGRFRVSQRDIDTLLSPLIAPPKRGGKPIRLIAINAGHGGKDPGNMEGARKEKVYTLALAKELSRKLKAAGFSVAMLRNDDDYIPLEDRAAEANRLKADLYVSLHFNGYEGAGAASVNGLETYCLTPSGAASSNDAGRHGAGWQAGNANDRENITLAHLVHRAVLDQTPLIDRGVRRARFKELTLLRMPGVLIEAGYMTHPADSRQIYAAKSREALASAIVDGIVRHKRLIERGQPE
jgi:N-acetylmuramoyl-L-alanine amidase